MLTKWHTKIDADFGTMIGEGLNMDLILNALFRLVLVIVATVLSVGAILLYGFTPFAVFVIVFAIVYGGAKR